MTYRLFAGFGLCFCTGIVYAQCEPPLLGSIDTPAYCASVSVASTIAHVADGDGGLLLIDVSDPAQPVAIGSLPPFHSATGVYATESISYLSDGGLHIVDVSDPMNPSTMGWCTTPGFGGGGVVVIGNLAYMGDGDSGLQIISVTDPTAPVIVGSFDSSGSSRGVVVRDQLAFVADGNAGLLILDVSDHTNPTMVGSLDTDGWASDVDVVGDLAFVADLYPGVQIIDISDPTHPTPLRPLTPATALSGSQCVTESHSLQTMPLAY